MALLNEHAREVLSLYCKHPYNQRYALLVKGSWGSGKTFLVDDFLQKEYPNRLSVDNNTRPLRISLYGLSNLQEISDQIYEQLHPRLSSKGMRLAALAAKGLLKTTVKVDLDELRTGTSASLSLPDIALPKFLTNARNRLVVFDDLERSNIPAADVLGFIHPLVEDGCKVIVISNEDEIDSDRERYEKTKEKTIGRTVEASPDFSSAFKKFLEEIQDHELNIFYSNNSDVLQDVFVSSETWNLRTLKQFMWDFEGVYLALEERHRSFKSGKVPREIMGFLYAAFVELRANRILVSDMSRNGVEYHMSLRSETPDDVTMRVKKMRVRYPMVEFSQNLIAIPDASQILSIALVDGPSIRSTLDRHPYFVKPDQLPSWRAAWFAHEMPDQDAMDALARFQADFNECNFRLYGEILHAVGLALSLKRLGQPGWEQISTEEIEKFIERTLGLTSPTDGDFKRSAEVYFTGMGWEGLGYRDSESDLFKAAAAYLTQAWIRWKNRKLPEVAKRLLKLAESDPNDFLHLICQTAGGPATYSEVPVLHHIDSKKFADAVLNSSFENQRTIFTAISMRYQHLETIPGHKLSSERDWVIDVRKALIAGVDQMLPIKREVFLGSIEHSFGEIGSKKPG